MNNLVSIPSLGVALPASDILGIRFDAHEHIKHEVSLERVARPLMTSTRTVDVVATLRFPIDLMEFITGEKPEGDADIFESSITLQSFTFEDSTGVAFFESPEYASIIEMLTDNANKAAEAVETATKKEKESAELAAESASKLLQRATKAPIALLNYLNQIESAQMKKSQLAPVKTTHSVGYDLTPNEDEDDAPQMTTNPVESQIRSLNEAIDKQTLMFEKRISMFNAILNQNSDIAVSPIKGSVTVNDKTLTFNDLYKKVFA